MNLASYAKKFIGRPYIWGGDGTGKTFGGFDCSGLVVECLTAFGVVKCDHTSQSLYNFLKTKKWVPVTKNAVKEDDILFFGSSVEKITHVSIAAGNGLHVEAGGGDKRCRVEADSTGFVRLRPISNRRDFVAAFRAP